MGGGGRAQGEAAGNCKDHSLSQKAGNPSGPPVLCPEELWGSEDEQMNVQKTPPSLTPLS